MKVLRSRRDLLDTLEISRLTDCSIGFVPTMGALHDGHLSLVKKAVQDNKQAVVSIFVNPEQFNETEDYLHYPRTENQDLDLLSSCMRENDLVFIPSSQEIYPTKDNRIFNLGHLNKVMEGLYRPGHFNGVARVVSVLFGLTGPCRSYFGEKDYQQLAVIRKLVDDFNFPVEVIACPTVREPDGLAMSSRNRLLSAEYRRRAAAIPAALFWAAGNCRQLTLSMLKHEVQNRIEAAGLMVEYVEIADEATFFPAQPQTPISQLRIFVAVRAGTVRLIDNLKLCNE